MELPPAAAAYRRRYWETGTLARLDRGDLDIASPAAKAKLAEDARREAEARR